MTTARSNRIWQSLGARERRVVAFGAIALVVMLGYAAAWRPIARDQARLDEQLPRLRAEAAQLRQAAGEIARLRAQAPSGTLDGSQLAALLARSAAARRLTGAVVTPAADGQRMQTTFARVALADWIAWADELHRTHRIAVVSTRIVALDAPGLVRIESEFAAATAAR